jgi:hypothetical protein
VSYDFRELFYTDYYGVKWSENGKNTTIHWMAISNQMNIPGENYGPVQVIPVSNEVQNLYQDAFELWDDALDTVEIEKTETDSEADISIGLVADLPFGADGQWNAVWSNNIFLEATIRIHSDILSEPHFFTTILHEIGNVLGLGDIKPNNATRSVQEDPFPEVFNSKSLWRDDVVMIKQLYAENNNVENIDISVELLTFSDKLLPAAKVELTDGKTIQEHIVNDTAPISFSVPTGSQVTVKVNVENHNVVGNICLDDALDALKIAVGLPASAGTHGQFKYISADFNRDGIVSSEDALSILKFSLNEQTSHQAEWIFIDSYADYSYLNKLDVNYSEGVSLEVQFSDNSVNLTGILVGDVNLSYTECLI